MNWTGKLAFMALSTTLVAACGGGGGGGGGGGSTGGGGGTPDVLTGTSPSDEATGIATSTDVSATFSEDVLNSSVSGNVTLSTGGTNVSGTAALTNSNQVTFSPDTSLSRLTTYTATATDGLTDTAGDPLLGSDYSWQFTTADGGWGPSAALPGADDGVVPQIDANANGDVMAIWSYTTITPSFTIESGLEAATFDSASDTWTVDPVIPSTDQYTPAYPQIALDGSGNAVAIWLQQGEVWGNTYAGSSWGSPAPIQADTSNSNAVNLDLASDGTGNAIAVWAQNDGTALSIYYSIYDEAAGTWSSVQLLESEDLLADVPKIALDDSGNGVVVWEQWRDSTGQDNIYARRYTPSGGFGPRVEIESSDADGDAPQVVIDGNGDAIAVWEQAVGNRLAIWSNRFDASASTWGTAELIDDDNSAAAAGPQIGVNETGDAVAVWPLGGGDPLAANHYTPGSGWGNMQIAGSGTPGEENDPRVAVEANGNAIVVWQEQDTQPYNVWANRFSAGTASWGSAEIIDDQSANVSDQKAIFDADQTGIALWQDNNGLYYSTFE